MTRVLYCNDLVPGCKYEAISTVHGMSDISDGILEMVRKAIHEEVRVRSRAASA